MEVRNKDAIQQLVEDKTTIQEVRSVIEKAKSKYESASEDTNARRWLRTFSTRVIYYSPVFDMLSQHHPEYVALAWGSVKFVLMVSPVSLLDANFRTYVAGEVSLVDAESCSSSQGGWLWVDHVFGNVLI